MRILNLKNEQNGQIEKIKCYEVSDFPYIDLEDSAFKVWRKKDVNTYQKIIATFDIETTTIIPENSDTPPEGFMYIWQMCIGSVLVFGRFWSEWVQFMQILSDLLNLDYENRMVVYVFNLSYEFQFIRNFLKRDFGGYEVFATDVRKPLHVVTNNGFEFRCAYRLTNMSLQKATESEKGVKHIKAVGDLDYKIKRLPTTELNDTEFSYCMLDVLSLWEFITCRLKNDKDRLDTIPMTSTGYVRRDLKKACKNHNNYRHTFEENYLKPDVYKLLKSAGRGGDTHANRYMAGTIKHGVDSFDVRSSYPSMILLRKFPMTMFTEYGTVEDIDTFDSLIKNYACLFEIVFLNLKIKEEIAMPYISYSKNIGYGKELKHDNGRILSADTIALTITDIDYEILKYQYTWDEFSIAKFYIAKYDYLPEPIRNTTLKYYQNKTELKYKIENETNEQKLEDLNYFYMKSKNLLNSIFGCMYTDPVRDLIEIDDSIGWKKKEQNLLARLEKYNTSKNSFLVYAWGCWVTAWARKHLFDLVNACARGNTSGQDNVIYCDTDSCKCLHGDFKEVFNLNSEIEKECLERGAYVDVGGKRYYLGIYEKETKQPYDEFITLGAKKYAYTENGELHITISGVNKKSGAKEMQNINNFKMGFTFNNAGRKVLYYNDDKIHDITVDGVTFETASNIGMVDSTYTIGLTHEYIDLIGYEEYYEL